MICICSISSLVLSYNKEIEIATGKLVKKSFMSCSQPIHQILPLGAYTLLIRREPILYRSHHFFLLSLFDKGAGRLFSWPAPLPAGRSRGDLPSLAWTAEMGETARIANCDSKEKGVACGFETDRQALTDQGPPPTPKGAGEGPFCRVPIQFYVPGYERCIMA